MRQQAFSPRKLLPPEVEHAFWHVLAFPPGPGSWLKVDEAPPQGFCNGLGLSGNGENLLQAFRAPLNVLLLSCQKRDGRILSKALNTGQLLLL